MTRTPVRPSAAEIATEIEETIARLQRGGDQYIDMPWPGGAAPIRVRILTRSERQVRFSDARRRFVSLGIDTVDLDSREEFAAEQITQVLAGAIMDPSRPIVGARMMCEPFFEDVDSCRDLMTDYEQAALWDVYLALERSANPRVGGGITAEMVELVREAQKKVRPIY